jgi:hypothetical protein
LSAPMSRIIASFERRIVVFGMLNHYWILRHVFSWNGPSGGVLWPAFTTTTNGQNGILQSVGNILFMAVVECWPRLDAVQRMDLKGVSRFPRRRCCPCPAISRILRSHSSWPDPARNVPMHVTVSSTCGGIG